MRILLAAAAISTLAGAAFAQSVSAPQPTTLNAPNGMPAASVTTTASSPVRNPTDGQVDGQTLTGIQDPTPAARADTAATTRAGLRPTESSMAPPGSPEGGITESAPMPTTLNAPNGQRASGVIVVSAPIVRNPTDGRVDGARAPK